MDLVALDRLPHGERITVDRASELLGWSRMESARYLIELANEGHIVGVSGGGYERPAPTRTESNQEITWDDLIRWGFRRRYGRDPRDVEGYTQSAKARAHWCPECGVGPGRSCKYPSGYTFSRGHASRRSA